MTIKPYELNKHALTESEQQLHIKIIEWAHKFELYKNYLFHIPNGGYRHFGEAKKFKKMGVKPGVSDLFFAYPKFPYHGMWIEIKSLSGSLTTTQRHWLKQMRDLGYYAICINSFDEFVKEITFYCETRN